MAQIFNINNINNLERPQAQGVLPQKNSCTKRDQWASRFGVIHDNSTFCGNQGKAQGNSQLMFSRQRFRKCRRGAASRLISSRLLTLLALPSLPLMQKPPEIKSTLTMTISLSW